MLNTKALAASVSAAPRVYVEDVFSTYLYTGNGSTQTITNGIDLSGKGGLVWIKGRSGSTGHRLTDTARGATKSLESNSAGIEATESTGLTSFSSTGFALGADADYSTNAATYASWTFRKQAKFFDVVTYAGTGSNRTIAHNLGSVPGCIIVKRIETEPFTTGNWQVYHRSLANTEYLMLNSTDAKNTGATRWNSTTPTSTVFSLGTDATVNASGNTYVAYLFAHDAGGFGDAGTDSVVKCGSFTGNGSATSGPVIDLGWEPQWLLIKSSSGAASWALYDNMRGMSVGDDVYLAANTTGAELTYNDVNPSATGFMALSGSGVINQSSATYIYIAIRRGPMKTPTDATKVFNTYQTSTNRQTGDKYDSNLYPPDLYVKLKQSGGSGAYWQDRIRGWKSITSSSTGAEVATTYIKQSGNQDELEYIANWDSGQGYANWYFRRAPGFFDVVAYTGTGVAHGEPHNLQVAPELVIWKERSTASNWYVFQSLTVRTYGKLNLANGFGGNSPGWFSSVTATQLNVCASSDNTDVNDSGVTYIAYLFATLNGVSKVGSYTGTGTTLNIDCGFTAGARFVLIARLDNAGDWYVWDTARGIISGNDPYLLLNSTAAEVTNTDYIDPLSSGFQISSTAPAAINASGGSFIFLAIA
jgi:hypothetical protein